MERLGKGMYPVLEIFKVSSAFGQNNRTRESSVAISPDWAMLEEIEFHRLAKLRLEVDDPEDLWVMVAKLHFIIELITQQRNLRTVVWVR